MAMLMATSAYAQKVSFDCEGKRADYKDPDHRQHEFYERKIELDLDLDERVGSHCLTGSWGNCYTTYLEVTPKEVRAREAKDNILTGSKRGKLAIWINRKTLRVDFYGWVGTCKIVERLKKF